MMLRGAACALLVLAGCGDNGGEAARGGGTDGSAGSGSIDATDVSVADVGDAGVEDGTADVEVGPDTIVSVELSVTMGHAQCGHLTLKLQSPDGTLLTLMSRPGAIELADDGSGTMAGSLAGLSPDFPISFSDDAAFYAENMGADFNGGTICKNGGQICEFAPDPGSASGPASFSQAFAGKQATGVWMLCVADSVSGGAGTLQSWSITFELGSGADSAASAAPAVAIPDDGYDGTLDSMTCMPAELNGGS